MAIIEEALVSRRLDFDSATREYLVYDLNLASDDDSSAKAAVLAWPSLPAVVGGFDTLRVSVSETNRVEAFPLKPAYIATVNWRDASEADSDSGVPSSPPPGTSTRINFDTTGRTLRVYKSLATASVSANTDPAPDHGGLILVNDGVPDGIDIVVPSYAWSETRYLSASGIESLADSVSSLTGKVNDSTFRGIHEQGQVLCRGITGGYSLGKDGEITISFEKIFNTTVDIGGTPTVIEGWDFIEYESKSTEDAASASMVASIKAAHVHRVYERASFASIPAL